MTHFLCYYSTVLIKKASVLTDGKVRTDQEEKKIKPKVFSKTNTSEGGRNYFLLCNLQQHIES